MAAAVPTLKAYPWPNGIDNTQHRVKVSGVASITVSPATYTTGGIAVTWSFTDQLTGEAILLNTSKPAIMAYFTSVSGSGYDYAYNKASQTLQIFTTGTATQSPKAELTGGAAIPAAVSSDIIEFDVEFPRAIL